MRDSLLGESIAQPNCSGTASLWPLRSQDPGEKDKVLVPEQKMEGFRVVSNLLQSPSTPCREPTRWCAQGISPSREKQRAFGWTDTTPTPSPDLELCLQDL
ncbi:hypothetical protein Zmor_002063 [Zophobas morio]|uniref:Uncharacterized protein n=1 Tax=Zophobas morio TaxID=2755281 RepID=A0AA38J030_9CUCU|nr:hypothetical protein Zmor_002063 [Zophobas morio]